MATPGAVTEVGKLNGWLDYAKDWLYTDGSQTAIQASHQHLLNNMQQFIQKKRFKRVWEAFEEMEILTAQIDNTREQAEIYLNCACISAEIENLKEALRFFHLAQSKYKSFPHQCAVTFWMTGCIHWSSGPRVNAISTWENAIELFKKTPAATRKNEWVRSMIPKMEGWLSVAIEMSELPPFAGQSRSAPASAQPAPAQQATQATTAFNGLGDFLLLNCPVTDTVAAGGFGVVGSNHLRADPLSSSFLEVQEVIIEGDTYQVYDIQRAQNARNSTVSILFENRYQTTRVNGNSMNRARPVRIEDGDFVLVDTALQPADNQIVIGIIIGDETKATIKRFKKRNKKILLIPESSEPFPNLDPEREFSDLGDEFAIFGVVKAVFKKK